MLSLGDAANWAQILGTIVPAVFVVAVWKYHNCRVPWCWRVGRTPVEGTHWKICDRHHFGGYHPRVKEIFGKKMGEG